MKYLPLLFIIISINACHGSKNIVESKPQKITEIVEINNDTISNKVILTENKVDKSTDTIKKEIVEDKNQSNEFNQILSKRFIELHEVWNELLQKHVSNDGIVNYKSFKAEHKKLLDYTNILSLAYKNDGLQSFSKEEKLAYWINAYNAFTIDLILRNYPIKSIKDIENPWDQRLWKLGDTWYNLNDIEHTILRKMEEPRIHFAIVCASYSCPKLSNEAYTASNLESQLTKATKDFLSDPDRNSISENNLEISKIFQWFTKDFKQNGSLIEFLNKYSNIKISEKAKITFKDYNWALNE